MCAKNRKNKNGNFQIIDRDAGGEKRPPKSYYHQSAVVASYLPQTGAFWPEFRATLFRTPPQYLNIFKKNLRKTNQIKRYKFLLLVVHSQVRSNVASGGGTCGNMEVAYY